MIDQLEVDFPFCVVTQKRWEVFIKCRLMEDVLIEKQLGRFVLFYYVC